VVDASPAPFVVTAAATPDVVRYRDLVGLHKARSAESTGPGLIASAPLRPCGMKSPCSSLRAESIAATATPSPEAVLASSTRCPDGERSIDLESEAGGSSRLGLTRSVCAAIVRSTAFQSVLLTSDAGSTTAKIDWTPRPCHPGALPVGRGVVLRRVGAEREASGGYPR
jgi:hypothetical protein